jgi:hypothetical protein
MLIFIPDHFSPHIHISFPTFPCALSLSHILHFSLLLIKGTWSQDGLDFCWHAWGGSRSKEGSRQVFKRIYFNNFLKFLVAWLSYRRVFFQNSLVSYWPGQGRGGGDYNLQQKDTQSCAIVRLKLKVRVYKEYHSVCMSPGQNWDSPNPSLASECTPPPRTGGGGAHSPAGEGLGASQFRRLEKKFSTLPTLWLEGMFPMGCVSVTHCPPPPLLPPPSPNNSSDLYHSQRSPCLQMSDGSLVHICT